MLAFIVYTELANLVVKKGKYQELINWEVRHGKI